MYKLRLTILLLLLSHLVLTAQGLIKSDDYGRTWESAGETYEDLFVNQIIDFNGQVLMATENKGVYLDGKNISKVLPSKKVNAITTHMNKIYISLYKNGIFETSNSGFTWSKVNSDLEVRAFLSLDSILLIGADQGIYILKDDQLQNVKSDPQINDFAVLGDFIFAATSSGISISRDGGKEWEADVEIGAVLNVEVKNDLAYAIAMNGKFLFSEDLGVDWKYKDFFLNEITYFTDIEVMGAIQFISTKEGILSSSDDGKTWILDAINNSLVIMDLHLIDNVLYAGTIPLKE